MDRSERSTESPELPPRHESGSGGLPDAGDPPAHGDESRRPVPVRLVMEGGEEEDEAEGREEQRTIGLSDGGQEWLVTVTGRSVSGVLPLRTIPLMELSFTPVGDPDAPPRRILCQGETLEALPEEELVAHLMSLLGKKRRRGSR